jgi:hypothetical protein
MAFTTTPYTTLADVKNAIRGLSSNEDDGFIGLLIQRAQIAIDSYCGYPFQQDGTTGSPATRNFNGNGGLVLPIEHCQSISTVTYEYQDVTTNYTGQYVLSTTPQDITADVVLLPLNQTPGYMIQRISGMTFLEGLQNLQIAGVWGYASVPLDITLAATFLVVHYYGMRDTYYGSALVQGNQTIKYTQTIPPHVRELLDRYRSSYFVSGTSTGYGPGNFPDISL